MEDNFLKGSMSLHIEREIIGTCIEIIIYNFLYLN